MQNQKSFEKVNGPHTSTSSLYLQMLSGKEKLV